MPEVDLAEAEQGRDEQDDEGPVAVDGMTGKVGEEAHGEKKWRLMTMMACNAICVAS